MSAGPRRTFDDDPGLRTLMDMCCAYTATDAVLAARLGIDPDTMARYRGGTRRPKRPVLERAAAEAERKAGELRQCAADIRKRLESHEPLRRMRAPRKKPATAPEPGSTTGTTDRVPGIAPAECAGTGLGIASAAEAALERAWDYAREYDVSEVISWCRVAHEADPCPAVQDQVFEQFAEMLYRADERSGPVINLADMLWEDRQMSPTGYAKAQYWAGTAAARAGDLQRAGELYGRALLGRDA